jgi:hypothetical protein
MTVGEVGVESPPLIWKATKSFLSIRDLDMSFCGHSRCYGVVNKIRWFTAIYAPWFDTAKDPISEGISILLTAKSVIFEGPI